MSTGKVHDKLIKNFLIINIGIAIVYILNTPVKPLLALIISILSYLIGGFYLSPDCDIESSVYYRWKLLRFIWIPYQKVIPHRSVFSHGFIIGSLIRVSYLFFIINFIIFLALGLDINVYISKLFNLLEVSKFYWILALISLEFSADIHIVADHSSTTLKKTKRKFLKFFK